MAALERRGSRAFVRAAVDEILLDATGTKAIGVRVNGEHTVWAKEVPSRHPSPESVGFPTAPVESAR